MENPVLSKVLGLSTEQSNMLILNELVDFTLLHKSPLLHTRSTSLTSFPSLHVSPNNNIINDDNNAPGSPMDKSPQSKYRKQSSEFVAFSCIVPSSSSSLQLFGSLSSGDCEENPQLMIVEVEACEGNHYLSLFIIIIYNHLFIIIYLNHY